MTYSMLHGLGDCTPKLHCGCLAPSVTDNARADAWNKGWHAGYTDRHLERVGHDGNMIRREQTPNPYRAAGRAETTAEQCEPRLSDHGQDKHCRSCGAEHRTETTTATVEDAARVIADHQPTTGMAVTSGITCRCGYWTGTEEPGKTRPVGMSGLIWHHAQMLAAAGLLATARTRPTR